jgi:polyhydroxybutyrate depolymerase
MRTVVAILVALAGSFGCSASSRPAAGSDAAAPEGARDSGFVTADGPAPDGARDSGLVTGDSASADASLDSMGVAVDAKPPGDAKPPVDGSMAPPTQSSGCGVAGAKTGDFHLSATDGNGAARDYEVIVPAGYDPNTPLALAFVYHGAGANESVAKGFGLQNAQGAATSAIFVFPLGIQYQSYGVGWDDSCSGYDMPFFDHMLSAIESGYCIDEARLFVSGFSWGGDETTALVCCRGDRIRAAAVGSSTDDYANTSDYHTYINAPCPVTSAAAIRFTHDANGDSAYPNPDFQTTSQLFQSWNQCTSSSVPVSPSPCESYDGCDHPFIECPYANLGHALPATWAADTWTFFSSFH